MTTDAPIGPTSDERIQAAAEREWNQRRRLFRIYIALLGLPLVAAGIALAYSETTRRKMTHEVTAGLRPQVSSIVMEEATPVIASTFEAKVGPALRRIDTVEAGYNGIQNTQKELDSKVATLSTAVQSVQAQTQSFQAIAPQLEQLPATLQRIDAMSATLEKTAARVGEIDSRQTTVARSIEEIGVSTRANANSVNELIKRVSTLETRVQELQKQISSMRPRVERNPAPKVQ
jgi:chaperonin cofactor prefoldin